MSPAADGPVLLVTGLKAEARLLRGPETLCVSAPPAFLTAKLEADCEGRFPAAVVSFGLAGGLAPGLAPGTLVLASEVIADTEIWRCDPALRERLRPVLAESVGLSEGVLAATDEPVMTRIAKAELHHRTDAVAVDTESHIAARFAAARGLPFLVLRAVTDVAEADLPPLALRAIDAEGRLDLRAIGGELIRRPAQLLRLPATGLSAAKAMRSLSRVRRRLGPRLGL